VTGSDVPSPRADREGAAACDNVIEVHVRDLSQLFDSMDPSPFHERDLDPKAEEYIVSSAEELTAKDPPTLIVHVDAQGTDETAHILREAIRVHFTRNALRERRALRDLLSRGRKSLAIALPVLAGSLVGGELASQALGVRALAQVIRESSVIGGWVAMWRPMEVFLYDWWPIRGRQRFYERLSAMQVRVVVRSVDSPPEPRSQSLSASPDHPRAQAHDGG
jgi:hypothetical protein